MEDTKNDFSKKYDDTYFEYEGKIYYGLGWESEDAYRMQDPLTNKNKAISLAAAQNVVPWFPVTGLYNVSFVHFPLWIARNGHRQWKRGFCNGSSVIISVMQLVLSRYISNFPSEYKIGNSNHHKKNFMEIAEQRFHSKIYAAFNTKSVAEYIKHSYPSFDEALKLLPGKLSVAISPEMHLMWALDREGLDLWYLDHHIGCIKNDRIVVNDPIFEQEVIDYTRRNSVKMRVAA